MTKMDLTFETGDFIVYPHHGVGQITDIEDQNIADMKITFYVINFTQDKMMLRVPISRAYQLGMRKLSSKVEMKNVFKILEGRARIKRIMWSRRAHEYETKINSGDPISIAEVVRDLHRNVDQREQSYSERILYETALERLARELAVVEAIEPDRAINKLKEILSKSSEAAAA